MVTKPSTLVTWGALLVVTQLLITEWTVHAAGDRAVIDYVSFAGTVVGMILAILAIVYSYISNASQKDDAVALRGQISSLNEAIARASASGNQFSSELARLEEIRNDLSSIRTNSERVLQNGQLLRELMESRIEEKRDESPVGANNEGGDFRAALTRLADRALPDQVVEYYLACVEDDFPDRVEYRRLIDELIVSAVNRKNIPFWKAYERGTIYAYCAVFVDFGLYGNEEAMTEFKGALLGRANSISESDAEATSGVFNKQSLLTSVRKVAELLSEELTGSS